MVFKRMKEESSSSREVMVPGREEILLSKMVGT